MTKAELIAILAELPDTARILIDKIDHPSLWTIHSTATITDEPAFAILFAGKPTPNP